MPQSDAAADIIVGPVADDNVYQSIRLFETGAYDMEYMIKRLKTELLHNQWVFKSAKALGHLHFEGFEMIVRE